MFIISLTYLKDLTEVEKNLEKHIEFVNKYYSNNKFICSGRKVPRTGGVILCRANSLDEVNEIIKEDPFFYNEIAKYEIINFTPTSYSDGFDKFI